jgi:hypothetical protein
MWRLVFIADWNGQNFRQTKYFETEAEARFFKRKLESKGAEIISLKETNKLPSAAEVYKKYGGLKD